MTIARAQMYRQLYQLGGSPTGIATMPMDYGQSLQVNNQGQSQTPLMSPSPNYSSATSITSNPLLNYGQPELGQAGGTPLTMRSGGISRLGYANGNVVNIEDQLMEQVQQPQEQMMQPAQPPLQGMEGQQPDIKDPKQALEIIIQMLIAQGVAPEEARQIALQMVQAVAEGGMEEMGDQRIEARFGGRIGYASGGIGSLVNREGYFLGSIGKAVGSIAKGAGKLVSGAVNAVKKVASSDLGKAALTVAAIYASGGGFSPQGFSMFGSSAGPGLLGSSGAFDLGSSYLGQGLFGTAGLDTIAGAEGISSQGLLGKLGITSGYGANLIPGGISTLLPGKGTLLSAAAGALGGALAGGMPQQQPGESDADYKTRVNEYKLLYQQGVSNPTLSITNAPMNLYPNNPFYVQRRANGGRIGYGFGNLVKASGVVEPVSNNLSANVRPLGLLYNPDGSYPTDSIKPIVGSSGFGGMLTKLIQQNPGMFSPVASSNGIADLVKQTTKQTYFGNVTPMYNYNLQDLSNLREENNDYTYAANGGRMGYAMGAEVPTRQNQAGVTELDYRDTGGFVPPIGIKERADDIPAMLSNNEFVFTADAVRNAGGGDENLGAQRMYKLMKNLEKGGRV
jgi:hypothetical protein